MDAAAIAPDQAAGRGMAFKLYGGDARRLMAERGLIVTPNLDHLRLLSQSRALRRAYGQADAVVNDSRLLDRLAFRGRAPCLPGSELAPDMLAALPPGGRAVIVGGDDAEHSFLAERHPHLALRFIRPSMGYVRRRRERREIVDAVLAARPDQVFVCTGAPQSELLAAQLKRAGCRAAILCCGSAFRFLAGAERRAPPAFRRLGAEWLWRFVRESRTRRRYAADALFLARNLPAFLALRREGQGRFAGFMLHAH